MVSQSEIDGMSSSREAVELVYRVPVSTTIDYLEKNRNLNTLAVKKILLPFALVDKFYLINECRGIIDTIPHIPYMKFKGNELTPISPYIGFNCLPSSHIGGGISTLKINVRNTCPGRSVYGFFSNAVVGNRKDGGFKSIIKD